MCVQIEIALLRVVCASSIIVHLFSVLANMLMKSGINPFDSQEAKPYKNDNEIVAMTNLVTAYQVQIL